MMNQDSRHRANYKMMLSQMKNSGRKGGFEKILTMVDDMVAIIAKEQDDDDSKKEFCVSDMDKTEDEQKLLQGSISDIESLVNEKADAIKALAEEIANVKSGIKEMDKSVATLTDQRKSEHAEFTEVSAANQAAVELLGMAKKRLAKFYSPKANLLQYRTQTPANEAPPERMRRKGSFGPANPNGGLPQVERPPARPLRLAARPASPSEEHIWQAPADSTARAL